jgi:regulator of protease activity HflC (stomatin/prohibitin superfamily)
VAVPVTLGNAGSGLEPGLHFVAPWAEIHTLSTKTANYTMDSNASEGQHQGNDAVVAHTLDNADVAIDSSVLYHLPVSASKGIVTQTGTDYEEKVIRPTIRNVIGDVATDYNATDLAASKRAAFEAEVLRRLEKEFQQYGLVVEAVKVRKIELPQGIIDSINAKIKSTQDLLNLQVKLQQADVNADIQRTIAKATADAQQIVACGAHFETVKGKQVVLPNDKDHCDQTQLTPQYLQYIYIQTLQKIAESKSNSTIVIPFDSKLTPLLNVK